MTLPPLPEPDTHCFDDDVGKDVWSHSPEQLHAYGEACAAAERERLRDLLRLVADEPNIDKARALADAEADPVARHLAAGVADHWRDECRRLRAGIDALIRERRGAESIREELQALLYRGPNVGIEPPRSGRLE